MRDQKTTVAAGQVWVPRRNLRGGAKPKIVFEVARTGGVYARRQGSAALQGTYFTPEAWAAWVRYYDAEPINA